MYTLRERERGALLHNIKEEEEKEEVSIIPIGYHVDCRGTFSRTRRGVGPTNGMSLTTAAFPFQMTNRALIHVSYMTRICIHIIYRERDIGKEIGTTAAVHTLCVLFKILFISETIAVAQAIIRRRRRRRRRDRVRSRKLRPFLSRLHIDDDACYHNNVLFSNYCLLDR